MMINMMSMMGQDVDCNAAQVSMMKVDSTTMMSMKKSHVIVSLERKIIAARKTAIKILM